MEWKLEGNVQVKEEFFLFGAGLLTACLCPQGNNTDCICSERTYRKVIATPLERGTVRQNKGRRFSIYHFVSLRTLFNHKSINN